MKKSVQPAAIAMATLSIVFVGFKFIQLTALPDGFNVHRSSTESVFMSSDKDNPLPSKPPGTNELIRKLYLETNGVISKPVGENSSQYNLPSKLLNLNYTNYAIVSVSTPLDNNYNYVFYVPLTVLSWQRIGYGTIVIISGSEIDWHSHHVLHTVFQYTLNLNALVIFLESKPENRVMISQVSRLFAASLLRERLTDTDFLLLSDIDLWPLNGKMYNLTPGYEIVSLNSECCGSFEHRGKSFKMLPMANLGASVSTWWNITGTNRLLPNNVDDILSYFEKEFGSVSRQAVIKGENLGWYQDQRMLSILIQEWIDRNKQSLVQYVSRNVYEDRVDRAWWSADTITNKTDAHLLENTYNYGIWFRLTPLLRLMYGEDSSMFALCMRYFEDFQTALKKNS